MTNSDHSSLSSSTTTTTSSSKQMFQRCSLPVNYNTWKEQLSPGTQESSGGQYDNSRPTGDAGRLSLRKASLHIKKLVAELEKEEPTLLQRLAKRVPCLGILMSICASFFLGSAGMLVKMTHSVHGIQVAVFRAMIQLIVYGTIIYFRRLSYLPKRRELLPVMGRALLGATSITCSYCALKMIPLGDATTIRFSLPIWTLIISYLVLNESCSLFKIGAVVVSIMGVVLIAKPDDSIYVAHLILYSLNLETQQDFDLNQSQFEISKVTGDSAGTQMGLHMALEGEGGGTGISEMSSSSGSNSYQLEGSLLALSSSICLSLSLVSLRLCKRTEAEITIFWLSVYSVTLGSVTLLTLSELRLPDNLLDCLLILLNGLCGCAGQWFITCALKIEQSGVISLARTFDIQVAFLYSAFLLHEHIRSTSIIGSLLVSLGVVAVVVPKWLMQTPQTAPTSSSSSIDHHHRRHQSSSIDHKDDTAKDEPQMMMSNHEQVEPLEVSDRQTVSKAGELDSARALPAPMEKRFSQPLASNYHSNSSCCWIPSVATAATTKTTTTTKGENPC